MLSGNGFCVALGAATFFSIAPAPRTAYEANPGRMSTQWIAEHRNSKPS
jgi:hypothetical protein